MVSVYSKRSVCDWSMDDGCVWMMWMSNVSDGKRIHRKELYHTKQQGSTNKYKQQQHRRDWLNKHTHVLHTYSHGWPFFILIPFRRLFSTAWVWNFAEMGWKKVQPLDSAVGENGWKKVQPLDRKMKKMCSCKLKKIERTWNLFALSIIRIENELTQRPTSLFPYFFLV